MFLPRCRAADKNAAKEKIQFFEGNQGRSEKWQVFAAPSVGENARLLIFMESWLAV